MIGLFWRIFFSFWAAMLLLLAVMAYSACLVANAWNRQSQLSYIDLVGVGRQVVHQGLVHVLLESGGVPHFAAQTQVTSFNRPVVTS